MERHIHVNRLADVKRPASAEGDAVGLTNRRRQPLSSQAIDTLLRNRLYVGIIDVPEFGVRDQRGDFDRLISGEMLAKAASSEVPTGELNA